MSQTDDTTAIDHVPDDARIEREAPPQRGPSKDSALIDPTEDDILERDRDVLVAEPDNATVQSGPSPTAREQIGYDTTSIDSGAKVLSAYRRVLALTGGDSELGQQIDFDAANAGPGPRGPRAPFSPALLELRTDIRRLLSEVLDEYGADGCLYWACYMLDLLDPEKDEGTTGDVSYRDLAERYEPSKSTIRRRVTEIEDFVVSRLEQGCLL